jgi:hypothetical protein
MTDRVGVPPPVLVESPSDEQETVKTVLAEHARGHPPGALWRTAIGGATNAILIWTQFPSIQWLASGFTAVAAYGLWGLIDGYIREIESKEEHPAADTFFALGLRTVIAAGGYAAALYTVVAFLKSLVHGWVS